MADTIVNLDIAEFWRIDLRNFVIAAPNANLLSEMLENSTEKFCMFKNNLVDYRDYFGANPLLLDLESLRQIFPNSKLISLCIKYFERYPESNCADQDFLNYIFSKDYLQLPKEISIPITLDRENQKIPRAILRFSSHTLGINTRDKFNRLWFEYFLKTPFFNLEIFANLFDTVPRLIAEAHIQIQNGKPIDLSELNYDLLRIL